MKVLHRFLKYKWYDMIDSGVKKEEYFAEKWAKRICSDRVKCGRYKSLSCVFTCLWYHPFIDTDYTHICFHRGYSNVTMTWSVDSVVYGLGNTDWGAPVNENVIIMKLAERITLQNNNIYARK